MVREVGPEPEQVGERRRDHDVRRGAVERLLIRRRRAQARRRRERGALRRVRFGEPPLVLVEAEVERGARGADRVFRQAQAVPERTRDVDGPGEPVPVVLLRLRRPPPARDPGGLLGVEGGREREETREETHTRLQALPLKHPRQVLCSAGTPGVPGRRCPYQQKKVPLFGLPRERETL